MICLSDVIYGIGVFRVKRFLISKNAINFILMIEEKKGECIGFVAILGFLSWHSLPIVAAYARNTANVNFNGSARTDAKRHCESNKYPLI
jgi:hypothetical protein